jgi:hypothetical protein
MKQVRLAEFCTKQKTQEVQANGKRGIPPGVGCPGTYSLVDWNEDDHDF